MATISFYRGTSTPTTSSLPDGGLYFNTSSKIIYFNNGGTLCEFKGTDNNTVYSHPTYTSKTSGLYKVTVDGTGHVSSTAAVTKEDITKLGIPSADTTYSVMTAATSSAAGDSGLVPAPAKGNQNKYLRGDGTWATPTNTTYSNATTSAAGLMSTDDKAKLNGIASGANAYTHPSYTSRSSGLYKITVDASGHVSGVTAVTKNDITALGIPGSDSNTTYNIDRISSTSVTHTNSSMQAVLIEGGKTATVPGIVTKVSHDASGTVQDVRYTAKVSCATGGGISTTVSCTAMFGKQSSCTWTIYYIPAG